MDYGLLNALGIIGFSMFGLWAFYHAGKRKKTPPPKMPDLAELLDQPERQDTALVKAPAAATAKAQAAATAKPLPTAADDEQKKR